MSPARKSTHRRFRSHTVEPGAARGLSPDHPAVVEARPVFPGTHASLSPRVLVSGHNNRKIGREVLKGRWRGMQVYTLTLEERRTCPRSCEHWLTCYGNAMHWARRHLADDVLESRLIQEVAALARKHAQGFVVRLHVLGDFYDVEYVLLWADLLRRHPQLHAYGYTGYRPDAEDPRERLIGQAIAAVRAANPERFHIRVSGVETRTAEDFGDIGPGEMACPAQQSEHASCGSCTWCWERSERVVFVRHGMKPRGRRAVDAGAPEETRANPHDAGVPAAVAWDDERRGRLIQLRTQSWGAAEIAAALGGTTRIQVVEEIHRLEKAGLLSPLPERARQQESSVPGKIHESAAETPIRRRISREAPRVHEEPQAVDPKPACSPAPAGHAGYRMRAGFPGSRAQRLERARQIVRVLTARGLKPAVVAIAVAQATGVYADSWWIIANRRQTQDSHQSVRPRRVRA